MPHLCVYASSSEALLPDLYETAESFGREAARQGWDLVFGGANIGLMNAAARGFRQHDAHIVSVIPDVFNRRRLTFADSDEVIVTHDLRDRKRIMAERASAFVALPGGPGTADELFETLTLKQLGLLDAPIAVLDHGGHFEGILLQLERMHADGFCDRSPHDFIVVDRTISGVLAAVSSALSRA